MLTWLAIGIRLGIEIKIRNYFDDQNLISNRIRIFLRTEIRI